MNDELKYYMEKVRELSLKNAHLLSVLKRIEWVRVYQRGEGMQLVCPSCDARRNIKDRYSDTHKPDCELDSIIKEADSELVKKKLNNPFFRY